MEQGEGSILLKKMYIITTKTSSNKELKYYHVMMK
jgi:hypothetical protein